MMTRSHANYRHFRRTVDAINALISFRQSTMEEGNEERKKRRNAVVVMWKAAVRTLSSAKS